MGQDFGFAGGILGSALVLGWGAGLAGTAGQLLAVRLSWEQSKGPAKFLR